jgi:hypothetical protein
MIKENVLGSGYVSVPANIAADAHLEEDDFYTRSRH